MPDSERDLSKRSVALIPNCPVRSRGGRCVGYVTAHFVRKLTEPGGNVDWSQPKGCDQHGSENGLGDSQLLPRGSAANLRLGRGLVRRQYSRPWIEPHRYRILGGSGRPASSFQAEFHESIVFAEASSDCLDYVLRQLHRLGTYQNWVAKIKSRHDGRVFQAALSPSRAFWANLRLGHV